MAAEAPGVPRRRQDVIRQAAKRGRLSSTHLHPGRSSLLFTATWPMWGLAGVGTR
jgi:hypothetical protein